MDVPRQNGEQARLRVVNGPDSGASFVLTGWRVTIGRGEENDVVIADLKASRVHAELRKDTTGWELRDAGSANGILLNGQAVKNARIKTHDQISLGETSFEFIGAEAGTRALRATPMHSSQLQASHQALEAQRRNVRAMGNFGGVPAGPAPGAKNGGGGRSLLLFGIVAALGATLLLEEEPAQTPKKPVAASGSETKEGEREDRNLASYLPQVDPTGQTGKTADVFFKTGFREYRERNYLRAKVQFETALQVDPGHRLATIYLRNCEKAIENEVKSLLELGRKSQSAGKLRDARGHFEAVTRLLYRDQANPSYLEATDQLHKVEREIKENG